MSGAFAGHLREAIAVNRSRRLFYARQTAGRSLALSNRLSALETALLPIAAMVDAWATRFQQRGVPILTQDFVSMEKINPSNTPPRYTQQLAPSRTQALKTRLCAGRVLLKSAAEQAAWPQAWRVAARLLAEIEAVEANAQAHLAMTKHLLESAALSARNAPDYEARSNRATRRLSQTMLLGHALLLPMALRLDTQAHPLHTMGAGILVNDVPQVLPFDYESATPAALTPAEQDRDTCRPASVRIYRMPVSYRPGRERAYLDLV